MKILKTKKFCIEAVVLFVIGIAIAILLGIRRQSASAALWISDMFFAEATVFLVWGLIRLLGNVHAFTGAAWGFKQAHRIFRREKLDPEQEKNDYLSYRESRPYHDDANLLLVIAGIWTVLSLVVSLTAVS